MIALASVTEQQDMLREVANVGAGNAARALSRLLGGERVGMDLPRAEQLDPEALARRLDALPHETCVAGCVRAVGGLGGPLCFVWKEEDARRLVAKLLPRAPFAGVEWTSAFLEAVNIAASAAVGAMGTLLGHRTVPSVPRWVRGSAQAVVDVLLEEELPFAVEPPSGAGALRWLLDARLTSETASGQLVFLPEAQAVDALCQRLLG